jgi:trimeric autotransporter adhesin
MEVNYNRNALSMTGITPVSTDQQLVNNQVYENKEDIELNTLAITNLDIRVSDLEVDVAQIATNTANIATNTSNISTNTSNIATNTSNIATNTTNIATNAAAIANINTDIGELTLLEASIDVNTIDILNLQSVGTNWVYNNSYGNPFSLTGYNQLFA